MAPPLSEAVVVDVLRRVDRLTAPLVRRLGRPPELPQAERDRWWADRVSGVAAGVSAVPRLAGKLADLLPLQNTLGSAVQAVVVGGVAAEHGVEDEAQRVSLLAQVLLDRDLPAERVRPLLERTRGAYAEEVLGEREDRSAVRTLWRVAPPLRPLPHTPPAPPPGT